MNETTTPAEPTITTLPPPAPEPTTAIAQAEKPPISAIALATTDHGTTLAASNLGDVIKFADMMSRSKIAIPKHLRDNPGACAAVCMQALQWGFNPFAVAVKSYSVNDVIAYEAQLIAAVINTRAGLKRRPSIAYGGEGAKRRCIVTGEFADGAVQIYESPEIGGISPKNSPLWKTDPDQQLAYYSLRAFARRYCPEVILGVYDRDEIEAINLPSSDVTDITAQLRDRGATAPAA